MLLVSTWCFMACSDDETSTADMPNELTLLSSKGLIEADGKDVAVFSVMLNGKDVTREATIYQKVDDRWTIYSGTEFSSDVDGNFEFSANYKNFESESILIQAATGLAALPADAQPSRFDDFRKRVLGMQFTGTTCGYCPLVIDAVEKFQYMQNADDVVFASLHSYDYRNDPMYTDDVAALAYNLGINGAPYMVFNLDTQTNSQTTTPESISSIVAQYMSVPAATAISASVVSDGAVDGKLKVQGAVKIGKSGKYFVSVWLLEDGITAPQSNYTSLTVSNNHDNVVRLCNTTSPMGLSFGGRTQWKAGETGVYYHEFDLKKSKVADLNNCRVMVYVSANTQGSFFVVDNVIECKPGEVKTFEYNNPS